MSRTRRNFSAKFKSELVIELLKGEKDLNTMEIKEMEREKNEFIKNTSYCNHRI